jgi:hypothetical protein
MAGNRFNKLGRETVIVDAKGVMTIPAYLLTILEWKPLEANLPITTDLDVPGSIFLKPTAAMSKRLQAKREELEQRGTDLELLAFMDRYQGIVISLSGEVTLGPALLSFLKIPPGTSAYLHLQACDGRLELINGKRRWENLDDNPVELKEND